jgi:hypothetical protein
VIIFLSGFCVNGFNCYFIAGLWVKYGVVFFFEKRDVCLVLITIEMGLGQG